MGVKYCGIYGARASYILFCNHQDTEYESREIEIGVAGSIFTKKNIKGPMGQGYPYPTIWEEILWPLFIFIELESFFYYFIDHIDTESESIEMEIGVAGLIFTQKNIKGTMGKEYL